MLIQKPERWRRDPGVAEMIHHFDQDKFQQPGFVLTRKEREALAAEVSKCQKDFEYAARNYFWITTKEGEDKLFSLWESQQLILHKINQLRKKGKPQKLMILKGRQLGCSYLIEALIAWRSMFFPNINAMVVSHVPSHASYLFSIMLHIYDQLPWWLRPMISSRREADGLKFQNPDQEVRREDPGLNSQVIVQAANQISGVGEGYRLNAVHASEYASWDQDRAREIIDGDMVHALADNVGTFAILESTAKGAGTYAEDLWLANVDLAERAEWLPLFLPSFMEKTRFTAPEDGWRPDEKELAMRERISREWVCCDGCGEFNERFYKGEDLAETLCPHCHRGHRKAYFLSDGQLCWMWERRINAERKGPESLKELRQELCITAEEAFQISGIQVFPQDTQDAVNETVCEPIAIGNLDTKGRFHGVRDWKTGACHQEWCKEDHRWDVDDQPLRIWEFPEEGCRYVVGVDVAEGLGGKADFSVAWVNRIGAGPNPDVHVATYRSNIIDPAHFAAPVNFLGRWYNDALMSIEYNIYQTTADLVRIFYQYPNLFRWKRLDSQNPLSNSWHWLTQMNTKPKLWQNAVRRLRARLWVVQDKVFAHEIKRFQKEDYEDRAASAETHFHDDVVMAAMIASYTSHDLDWDEDLNCIPSQNDAALISAGDYTMDCLRCKFVWSASNPEHLRGCPKCGCIMIHGKQNASAAPPRLLAYDEMGLNPQYENEEVYEEA